MAGIFQFRGFIPYTMMIFLNAFVDLGHKIVIQNTIIKTDSGQGQIILIAIVNALILLPFVMLFTPSGFLADKYPKNRVMRISAWGAVILTCLITLFYYLGLFWTAFAMTFMLAVQSAFYSPAKYGYIKELVGRESLARANGAVQATTTIAILAGTFVFSILFEAYLGGMAPADKSAVLLDIAPIGWFLVLGAIVELVIAYRLPQTQEANKNMPFDWAQYRQGSYLKANLRTVSQHEVIFLSIIGLATFWAIAQVLLAAFPVFAEENLGITNTAIIQGIMACAGIGIMLGSIIAGRISRNHIETGLIPIGSFGVALAILLLPHLDSPLALGLNFVLLGLLGGLFIIPLNALIQFHATEHILGRVLAGSNFIQNMVMLSFLGLTVVFAIYGINSIGLFGLLTIVAIAGALYTLYKLPQSMLRFVLACIIGRRYRLDVLGFKHLPESGGMLMLGNHISWIDWAIVQMACPRPISFVMENTLCQRWYLKWFLDFFGVVPIGGNASQSALNRIGELLRQGQAVCLFPESTISRRGQLAEFRHDYEKAVAGADGIILPFYLRGLCGSWFSRCSNKLKSMPGHGVRRDIIIAFGRPLPFTTRADKLKRAIAGLAIDAWQRYTDSLEPICHSWFNTLRRMSSKPVITDTTGTSLSSSRFAAVVICFSRLLRQHSKEPCIGVLLPAGSGGVIMNMACLSLGRTVVNLNYSAGRDAMLAAIKKAEIKSIYTSEKFLQGLAAQGIALGTVFAGINVYYLEELKAQVHKATWLRTLLIISLSPAWLLKLLYCKAVSLEDPAAILFSSGSEGEPKGVMLSHRHIMANLKQIAEVLNTEEADVVMASLPLFHAFGFTVTGMMPLIEGLPMVCHPDPGDAVNVARAIARHRATIFFGTSAFLQRYTRNRSVHPLMLESLRIVVAGAEKLSPDVGAAFKLKFNKDIYEGYGTTETTPIASVNIPDHLDTRYLKVQPGNKPGTVGLPLPGTRCRIVDPDSLNDLPTNEDGLVLIGGAQIMLGYLQDREKTREVIVERDGRRWYKTGDKGRLDDDGFLTIVDRYSRFARLGGEMISLTAVEEQIRHVLQNPELALVAMSLTEAGKGEKIVLMITENIAMKHLKKALLDNGFHPLTVPAEIYCVDEIPTLGSGKTDFKASREKLLDILAANEQR